MKILTVETSCDDTCIALADASAKNFKLLSNLISSQVEIHKKWGGVYPTLAKREHQANLVPLLKRALKEANLLRNSNSQFSNSKQITSTKFQIIKKILDRETALCGELIKFLEKYQKPKIDYIAVTVGPGLDPCLWTGVNFARAVAYWWELPIIPVNHIEGHIFANFLAKIGEKSKCQNPNVKSVSKSKIQKKTKNRKQKTGSEIDLPAVCLIVSGGHTQIILAKKIGEYKILGETRDDAAGEAFDKIARILGLGYPGGPAIAQQAKQYKSQIPNPKFQNNSKFKIQNSKLNIRLPRPMLNTKDYDFSFSGLKTAVLYDYIKRSPKIRKSKEYIQAMAKEAQQSIIDVLIKKTIKAAGDYRAKTIMLGGGVAANKELRKQFENRVQEYNSRANLIVSDAKLCTDNAAMIAMAAYQLNPREKAVNWNKIKAEPNLRIASD